MIPYGKQNINNDDIKAVIDVMESDFLTQGPMTPLFEEELKNFCNAKFALATINATSALHLACLSIGIGKGDTVWTSPISFVASANCVKYCGGDIDFVDIDPKTYNISIKALEEKLIKAKKEKKLPKAIIPVHLSGQSCDMIKIFELSKIFDFKIIEDASHAIGGYYDGLPVGSCQYSDITVFSFHPVKIITTCEGGACMTNNEDLYRKMYDLRSHGIVRNQKDMINKKHGSWYYEQKVLGYNYRLNDLQAALGINQIKKLSLFVKERHKIAEKYNEFFQDNENIQIPYQIDKATSSYHLYIIKVSNKNGFARNQIFNRLRERGILVNVHYIPIYKHPFFSKDFNYEEYPNSEDYYSKAISLPIYPYLEDIEVKKVVQIIYNNLNFQHIF